MKVNVLAVDGVFDLGLSAVLDVFQTANELIGPPTKFRRSSSTSARSTIIYYQPLGNLRLTEIDRQAVEQLLTAKKDAGLGWWARKNIRTVLSAT